MAGGNSLFLHHLKAFLQESVVLLLINQSKIQFNIITLQLETKNIPHNAQMNK